MSRNKEKSKLIFSGRNTLVEAANKALTKMRIRELQAACIMRGMLFEEVVEGDHGVLATYFIRHFDHPTRRDLLENFDRWVDEQLSLKYQPNDPIRKFKRFTSENEEKEELEIRTRSLKKADIPKKKKTKKERDTRFGIFKGTAKSLTYELAADLWDKKGEKYNFDIKTLYKRFKEKAIEKVNKHFPDAQGKSVLIWFKRALNACHVKK